MRRRLERQLRADKTKANHQLYAEHCRVVNDLIRNAKEVCYSTIIDNNHGNQQMLFQAINNLLYRKPLVRYPSTSSDSALTEQFKSFFIDKIRLIRESLPVYSPSTPNLPSENSVTVCPCEGVTFQRVSTEHIAHLIKSSEVKTCALDPLPASLLTKCWSTLLPVITDIVNRSLEGFMPNAPKSAMITSLLKKPNLNPEEFKNFRQFLIFRLFPN